MAANGGSIINIGTIAAQLGTPGTSVYSASKAAVESLTRPGPPNSRRVEFVSTPSRPTRHARLFRLASGQYQQTRSQILRSFDTFR
jgi:hypothetical protein